MSSQRGAIRVFVLRAIDRCNGQPIPGNAVLDAVRIGFPHVREAPELAGEALEELERRGYAMQGEQDLTGETLWALTDKGRLQAANWR